jgi:hypothetical protein
MVPDRRSSSEDGTYAELFFDADIGLVDPNIDAIIGYEEERQTRKLIMIPSESMAPKAVRQALGSVFNNVYAEGYPPLRMTRDDEDTLLDIPHQLAYYRRYGDRRFYKGVDYVHFIETLAQRRAADCLANERVSSIFMSTCSLFPARRPTWRSTTHCWMRATRSWEWISTRAGT